MASETGGSEQQYSLRWNDFHSAILSSFRHLRDEEDFVDVTLACDGCSFSAHKVVLSACSPYFRKLLKANPCQHPIVILRDIHNKDMESLLRFMYNGEVHIGQEQLGDFLKAAQMLQVRGLADVQTPGGGPPLNNIDHKSSSPSTLLAWPELTQNNDRDRSRTRKTVTDNSAPPPKRARSSDLYNAQMRSRTEQLVGQDRMKSPERTANNGLDLRDSLLGQALESNQNMHSNNMSDDSSSDGEMSDSELAMPPRNALPKQEPLEYSGEDSTTTNGGTLDPPRTPSFPGALLGLQGLLPGPSGMHGTPDNFVSRRSLDLLRVRATDPRPCPKCGKIYRSAHTLRTHLEDKHTICPGYRCVLCGTVAKSRNSLHSHMSRQHRGISTKDLPVLPMPSPFDPELASRLLAKAGVKISPAELRARASPTGPRRSDIKLDAKSGQSAPSETSSICGDNDPEDLTITPSLPHRYSDVLPMSPPPSINNLSNTTITKVPAVKAISAKSIESIAQNLSGKPEDYPAALGGSAILDTYLQFMAENSFGVGVTQDQITAIHAAKLAQLNVMSSHLDRKQYHGNYDKLSPPPHPQQASLPPVSLAHQHFLEQMHRHYTENMVKADITRLDDGVLNLGKGRDKMMRDQLDGRIIRRNSDGRDDERDSYRKVLHEDDNSYDNRIENISNRSKERRDSSGHDEDDYSDEDMQKDGD